MAEGFKIADGYVEIHGVVDRRAVVLAADQVTRGVSEQMTTGVAFGNLREGGRKMGATLGEHAGPSAARETTEGLNEWIDKGPSAGHVGSAGARLGELLGRSGGSPFVEHIIAEIDRRASAGQLPGGGGGTVPAPGDRGDGRDSAGRFVGRGGSGGSSRGGDGGRGGSGGAGGRGGDAESEGRSLGRALGVGALGGFMNTFSQGFSGPFRAIISNPIIGTAAIALGAGLAVLAAPAFGAAFAATLIGGAGLGVIGLGAWLVKDDPEVRKAATSLGNTAKGIFKGAAKPMADPLVRSMGILEDAIVRSAPQLTELFMAITPAIEPLTRGLAGFVEGALPGFIALVKAAVPFFKDMESTLPRFGEHISKFLTVIADAGPAASLFFRDFIHIVGILLVALGYFVEFLSSMYGASRTIIGLLADAFIFFFKTASVPILMLIEVFRRWYNFVRDVFFAARRDSDGFVGFLKMLPQKVWQAIQGVPGKIIGVFKDAGGWLKRAGENIIGGLLRGIRDAIPALNDLLGWVTSKIPDWKGPEEKDAQLLVPTGRTIMRGLGAGLAQGAMGVRDQLGAVTASLPAAVSSSTTMGGVTINIQTQISSWAEVPGEVVAQLDAALSRYRKAYA